MVSNSLVTLYAHRVVNPTASTNLRSAIIVGAAVLLFVGWAITHRFIKSPEEREVPNDWSQAQYMREVRVRHIDDLAARVGHKGIPV